MIERIAALQRLTPSETKALHDLCSWKEDEFRELLQVVGKFECYETQDVKEKKKSTVHLSKAKMSRGEVHTMTSRLLVRLSKVPPQYFLKIADCIKTGKISLKTAVDMFEKDQERRKVLQIIEEISGQEFKNLKDIYQNNFTLQIVDSFLGASETNNRGEQLRQYVRDVMSGKKPVKRLLKISLLKPISEIVKVSDTLLVNCNKLEDQNPSGHEDLLDSISTKQQTTVLVFDKEEDQLDALLYLRAKSDIQTKQLFFGRKWLGYSVEGLLSMGPTPSSSLKFTAPPCLYITLFTESATTRDFRSKCVSLILA